MSCLVLGVSFSLVLGRVVLAGYARPGQARLGGSYTDLADAAKPGNTEDFIGLLFLRFSL